MKGELAQTMWFTAFQRRRAIGNPDALPIAVHLAGLTMASGLLWTSAGKERTVEHTQFQLPRGIRDSNASRRLPDRLLH
jgi:hypothetical protein